MSDTTMPPATAAPWFGRPWEHRQAAVAAIGSLAACGLFAAAANRWASTAAPGWIEFSGTATSLWSVWITQRRNVLALPVGIASVILTGWFFLDISLIGQALLHWGYYLPVQFWAWKQWTRGGEDRTELRVTRLTIAARGFAFVAVVVFTLALGRLLDAGWDNALYTYWDASIVAASIVAMVLLSRKKVESWWLWILPVDVSAIGLYVVTEAYMFASLYVLFLVMAIVGLTHWVRAAAVGST